jgi:deoxyribonuclease-4
MKVKIGTHVSFTKKETLTELIEFLPDTVQTIQIYLGPKIGGETRVLEDEDVDNASKIIGKRGFFVHSCLTNYLSCGKKFKQYCKKKIVTELKHVKKFPISGVVIHPGTCNADKVKRDLKETLEIIIDSITEIYKDGNEDLGMLLLENCAGEGSKVPKTLSEIRYILEELEKRKDKNGVPIAEHVGVCIDTCHIFAAGEYDFSKSKEIVRFKKDFKEEIGLKYLKLIHLNDSQTPFGSKRDRHEILGKGYIWKDPRLLTILFKLFKKTPFICETKSYEECLPFIMKAEEYF